jgi:hypothetical protein
MELLWRRARRAARPPAPSGAGEVELHRGRREDGLDLCPLLGHGQRLDLDRQLEGQPQPLARRDHEPRLSRAIHPLADGLGRMRGDLLEVVEHDQHPPPPRQAP